MAKILAGQMAYGLPDTLHESIRGYVTDNTGALLEYKMARVVTVKTNDASEILRTELGGTGPRLRVTWSPERSCGSACGAEGTYDKNDPAYLLRVGAIGVDVDLTNPSVRPTESTVFRYNTTTGQISDKAADQAFPADVRVKFIFDDAESGVTALRFELI